MKNLIFFSGFFSLVISSGLKADPTDANNPSKIPYVGVESALTSPIAPPGDSVVRVGFTNAIDGIPAAKITNYSLGQIAPEIGGGTPGGTLEDLDGDGDLDMVIAIDDKIVAYENKGTKNAPRYSGQPVTLVTVGFFEGTQLDYDNTWYNTVAFGDLNGDGNRDMICGEAYDGQVTCFFRINGKFQWPAYGNQKRMLQDYGTVKALIEVSTDESSWWFDISVPSIAIEDLDQDGHVDLVVGDPDSMWSQPQNIQVYRGTGRFEVDGSPIFQLPVSLKAGGNPITLEWTFMGSTCPIFYDMDRDGAKDLIVSTTEGEIWIYKATGRDTNSASDNVGFPVFAAGQRLLDDQGQELRLGAIHAMSICDYSNDGDPDLAIVSEGVDHLDENRFRLMENIGGGGLRFLGKPSTIGVGGIQAELRASYASKPVYFDFDRDQKIDVLYAGTGYGLAIAYNVDTGDDHDPFFAAPIAVALPAGVADQLGEGVPDIADFNADGVLDAEIDGVVVGTEADLLFFKYLGPTPSGPPSFAAPVSILPSGFTTLHYLEPTVGDLNGDGKLDVVLASGGMYAGETRDLLFLSNSSATGFSLGVAAPLLVNGAANTSSMFPEIVDFDGDGLLDVLVADRSPSFNRRALAEGKIRFLKNLGGYGPEMNDQGLIQTSAGTAISMGLDASVRAVDFDRDNKIDLLISPQNSSVAPFLNTSATGTVLAEASPRLLVTATLASSVTLSGDGKQLDIGFPTIAHPGNILNLNELYVGGQQGSINGIVIGFDPIDSDDDDIPDYWEYEHFNGLNGGPPDGDWLTDLEEYQRNLNPLFNDDVDMDGWVDGEEAQWINLSQTDDLVRPSQLAPWADRDGDGLANALESELGTGPDSPGLPIDWHLAPVIRLMASEYDASSSRGAWINRGRLGDTFFSETGKALPSTKNGKPAVEFQSTGADWMVGPRTPSWMNGGGSRTVAAWIFNPTASTTDDDVIVSWGGGSSSAPQPTLFSCRDGLNVAHGAVAQSGNGGLDRGWGSVPPVDGTWSFVVYRYDSHSGSLISMRNFEAAFLQRGLYLETGILGTDSKPYQFVVGGENLGNGTRNPSIHTGLCIGDLWVWDRSVPLAEIIASAYEPLRVSYGQTTALVDGDSDGVPTVLENSLGWKSGDDNSDDDTAATGGGKDGIEFDQGTDALDFFNGRPHSIAVTQGNNQTIYGTEETAPIHFTVKDLDGIPIVGAPLNLTVLPQTPAIGEIRRLPWASEPLGTPYATALPPVPVTDATGEVSIIFKAN